MVVRIAIVDDENMICSQLEEMLEQISHGLNRKFEIDIYNSGESIKSRLEDQQVYHLIFLDIELKFCSGIDVGHFIREQLSDETIQIVFISGKDGYDRQLFEFRPLGFIEKPFLMKKVAAVIEKYLRIYEGQGDIFTYKYGRDAYCVRLSRILYFKSNDKNILIKTIDGEEGFLGALKNVREQLKPKGFFMPNRSYLVNYSLIRSFRPNEILMINGDVIPISRNNKDEVSDIRIMLENGGI